MARADWDLHGTHADFWRSDNPVISWWHRFGDAPMPGDLTSSISGALPAATDHRYQPWISGMFTCSGPRKKNLTIRDGRYTGSNLAITGVLQDYYKAVPGIAPWALTGSGMQFLVPTGNLDHRDGASLTVLPDPDYVTPRHFGTRAASTQYPTTSVTSAVSVDNAAGNALFGDVYPSGSTIIGWLKVADLDLSDQWLFGSSAESMDIRYLNWGMKWSQVDGSQGQYTVQPVFQARDNFTFNGTDTTSTNQYQALIDSDDHPYFPRDRTEPFWISMTYRPLTDPITTPWGYSSGSGVISVMLGTEASGVVVKDERTVRGPRLINPISWNNYDSDLVAAGDTRNCVPFTYGSESTGYDTTSNTRKNGNRVAPGTVYDEFVWVDMGLPDDRIVHYAMNGMTHVTEDDPYHPDFTPVAPGTEGLVAYYTFNDAASPGHNSAPDYETDPKLQLNISGMTHSDFPHSIFQQVYQGWGEFEDGIGYNQDRVLVMKGKQGEDPIKASARTASQASTVGGLSLPLMSGDPGTRQPHEVLCATPHNTDRGQTFLVRCRPSGYNSSTQYSTTSRYLNFSFGNMIYNADVTSKPGATSYGSSFRERQRGDQIMPKGQYEGGNASTYSTTNNFRNAVKTCGVTTHQIATTTSNKAGAAKATVDRAAGDTRYLGTHEGKTSSTGEWELQCTWLDFDTFSISYSKDAKLAERAMHLGSPASGIEWEHLKRVYEPSVSQKSAPHFSMCLSNAANLFAARLFIDSIAIYNRPLSLAEQSGFMLFGIQEGDLAPNPEIQTYDRRLGGYWPLNEFTNYDPTDVSGFRANDYSWHSHHLTNISGTWTTGPNLNTEQTDFTTSLSTVTSGAMISLEKQFHGHLLDGADEGVYATSGICFGAWIQLPSDAHLDGRHHIMSCWGEDPLERSWALGVDENKLFLDFYSDFNGTPDTITSNVAPTYGAPFFVAGQIFPSGGQTRMQLIKAEAGNSILGPITYVGDAITGFSSQRINASSTSGFALLNAPNQNYGFPADTSVQHAFVYHGHRTQEQLENIKRSQVNIVPISTASVSTTDPATVAVWNMNESSWPLVDSGPAQNYLNLRNLDGHDIGSGVGIHGSAVMVREAEYFTTDDNLISPNSGLYLGSNGQSFTVLGWTYWPNETISDDQRILLDKGSNADVQNEASGLRIFAPSNGATLSAITSPTNIVAAQNGSMTAGQWNHVAVTYDQGNEEFGLVVNGRYAETQRPVVGLGNITPNESGLVLGGRGDELGGNPIGAGAGFSGLLDDWMVFNRALTLPEISGIAANSFNYDDGSSSTSEYVGVYVSGIEAFTISGLLGNYLHGINYASGVMGGHISGVKGVYDHTGGYVHGLGHISGVHAAFTHGSLQASGWFGSYFHGKDMVSGVIGSYQFGMCEALDEFDLTLTFQILTSEQFDARLGVEKTELLDFDARLGVIQKTRRPTCTFELPHIETVEVGGAPHTLTIRGSGIAYDNKDVSKVRFTFADFRGAESGTLVQGIPNSGLYEVERTFDTPGWYTIKMEVVDSFGYSSTCVRPWLLVPSTTTSGAYLSTLPQLELTSNLSAGSTIQRTEFTHTLTGLESTSGILEYTDFADGQESLVNSTEVPSGTTRTHDYTMPGYYCPVWAVSGSWGIVSDSTDSGVDFAP